VKRPKYRIPLVSLLRSESRTGLAWDLCIGGITFTFYLKDEALSIFWRKMSDTIDLRSMGELKSYLPVAI